MRCRHARAIRTFAGVSAVANEQLKQHNIKDSIASQRYVTPREFAVNNVTLRNVAPSVF